MLEPCSSSNPVDIVRDASRSCVLNNPVHLKASMFEKFLSQLLTLISSHYCLWVDHLGQVKTSGCNISAKENPT